jgi:hypothetical protein
VRSHPSATQHQIFLGIFLAFLILEGVPDVLLRVPFRTEWRILTPYLVLYHAMNYGFVVMVWKASRFQGIIMLLLLCVQIVVNLITHQTGVRRQS